MRQISSTSKVNLIGNEQDSKNMDEMMLGTRDISGFDNQQQEAEKLRVQLEQ